MPVAGEEQQGRRFFSRKTDESDIMQWQLKPKCASSDTALELSYSIAADRMGGEQCDRRATPRSGAEAAKFTFMPTPRRQQSRNKSQMPVARIHFSLIWPWISLLLPMRIPPKLIYLLCNVHRDERCLGNERGYRQGQSAAGRRAN